MSAVRRARPDGTSALARPPLTAEIERPVIGDSPATTSDSGTPVVRESRTPVVPKSRTPEVTDSGSSKPRYLTLERVDARLRPDQVEALTEVRKRVSKQRADRSERITDNTIIRIAVDLLLARAHELAGDTEDDLRRSLLGS